MARVSSGRGEPGRPPSPGMPAPDAAGCLMRELLGKNPAEGRAEDVYLFVLERVEQQLERAGQAGHAPRSPVPGRAPGAGRIDGDCLHTVRVQRVLERRRETEVCSDATEQQQRTPGAPDRRTQPYAVDFYVSKVRHGPSGVFQVKRQRRSPAIRIRPVARSAAGQLSALSLAADDREYLLAGNWPGGGFRRPWV